MLGEFSPDDLHKLGRGRTRDHALASHRNKVPQYTNAVRLARLERGWYMRAAVVRAPGQIAIESVQCPRPERSEVLVRLVATGVCHTDLSAYRGRLGVPMPVVLGHEGAGIVEEVGDGVT